MSDSENESDFASAESDQEEAGVTQDSSEVQSSPQQPDDDIQPCKEDVTTKEEQSVTILPEPEQPNEAAQVEDTPKSEETIVDPKPEPEPEPEPEEPSDKAPTTTESGGGWGWGGWGSLWSSVSTVTESAQALGSKVSSVIASVEEGLGLPSPTELAQANETEEERRLAEFVVEHDPVEMKPIVEEPHQISDSDTMEQNVDNQSDSGFGGFLSGFASAVQSTGKGLVSGGLDALETLGKKTMNVLSEGDPGLQKKRALLAGQGSPTLSQLLEEAKNRPESGDVEVQEESETPLNYSRLFDEYNGVVHLEALELLSKECAAKVMGGSSSFVDEDLEKLREKVEELEASFQVEEDQEALDDDSSKLAEILKLFSPSNLPLKADKLVKVSNAWRDKVEQAENNDTQATPTNESVKQATPTDNDGDDATPTGIEEPNAQSAVTDIKDTEKKTRDPRSVCETLYGNGLRSLAELTSASIELYRKMAELSLLPDADKGDQITQAKKLNRLTVLVCSELDCLASVHSEAITKLDLPDTNSNVTSLYLEASNSSTYVQDAFELLLPVLKYIQIQQLSAEKPEPNVLSRT